MTDLQPKHALSVPTTDGVRVGLGEVISVVHTKGGAGKSSLATNLAYALAGQLYRVLVIDLDRQTGQSVGFGIADLRRDRRGRSVDVGAVLLGDAQLQDAVVRDVYPGLDVLPADERSLLSAERGLVGAGVEGQVRLYQVLYDNAATWDVIIVDTPGRQTEIVDVALAASTGVLVPAIPEGGPVAELGTVLRHIARARELLVQLEVYGLVRMRVGGNSRYRQIAEEQTKLIAEQFGVPLFRNKVPEDARFGESHLAREPIGAYASSSRSAIAYRYVADELASRRNWPRMDGSVGVPLHFPIPVDSSAATHA